MMNFEIKKGRFILTLPNIPEAAPFREELNMKDVSVFVNVYALASDQKDSRITPYNPTGDFVRFFDGIKEYEVNPYLVSSLKGADGVVIPPAGANYTTTELVNAFINNFF